MESKDTSEIENQEKVDNKDEEQVQNQETDDNISGFQNQDQKENVDGVETDKQTANEDNLAKYIWEKIKKEKGFDTTKTVNFYVEYRNEINNGINIGDNATMQDINFHTQSTKNSQKDNMLSLAKDNKKMSDWISRNYFKPAIALLITTAVFNEMPYNWIIEEKEKLYYYLVGKEKQVYEVEAVEKTLYEIGAEICDGEISDYAGKRNEKFIRYQDNEDANKIIGYIWIQFPNLKMPILKWFIKHIEAGRGIYVKRITDVMSLLALKDYSYFVNNIITYLYKKENVSVDITLSQILNELLESQRESVVSMLAHWSTQKRVHPLLTVLLVTRETDGGEKILRRAMNTYLHVVYYGDYKKEEQFLIHLFDFFAVGVRKVVFYRILIEELYDLFFKEGWAENRYKNLDLFLSFLWIDIFLSCGSDNKKEEAILVKMCVAENTVKNKLCQIWNKLWKTHVYRTEFYQILGEYYKQLENELLRKRILMFLDMILGDGVSREKKYDIYIKIKKQSDK